MNIKIDKCEIPVIWLDTSVIIYMTKALLGLPVEPTSGKRALALHEAISKQTMNHKLICPRANQEDEIAYGSRLFKDCHDMLVRLSLGTRLAHYKQIENTEKMIAMKAFIQHDTCINYSYRNAFLGNPTKDIKEIKHYIISVYPSYLLEGKPEKQLAKEHLLGELENVRKQARSDNVRQTAQIEEEFLGEIRAYNIMIDQYLTAHTEAEVFEAFEKLLDSYGVLLSAWNNYGGYPPGSMGLFTWMLSDSYRHVPNVRIKSHLWGRILTRDKAIGTGDGMDIQQISSVLPYCHWMVMDADMAQAIKQFKFDQEYNTAVYSMREIDKLLDIINSL